MALIRASIRFRVIYTVIGPASAVLVASLAWTELTVDGAPAESIAAARDKHYICTPHVFILYYVFVLLDIFLYKYIFIKIFLKVPTC